MVAHWTRDEKAGLRVTTRQLEFRRDRRIPSYPASIWLTSRSMIARRGQNDSVTSSVLITAVMPAICVGARVRRTIRQAPNVRECEGWAIPRRGPVRDTEPSRGCMHSRWPVTRFAAPAAGATAGQDMRRWIGAMALAAGAVGRRSSRTPEPAVPPRRLPAGPMRPKEVVNVGRAVVAPHGRREGVDRL